MPSIVITPSGAPIVTNVGGGVEAVRQAIHTLSNVLEVVRRADGGAADSAVTLQDLADLGYISLTEDTATRIEGWDDLTADLASGKVAGSNVPAWSQFRNGIYAYEFSATVLKEIWITFHVNHNYKDGTNVYPHIHWSPTTTDTGVVRWGFEYTVAKGHDQQAFPATQTVYVEHTVSSNKQYQHIISEVVDGDAFSAFEPDSLILMRIFRDGGHANDTFPAAVHAFTADIHFQGDGQFTANKEFPFD